MLLLACTSSVFLKARNSVNRAIRVSGTAFPSQRVATRGPLATVLGPPMGSPPSCLMCPTPMARLARYVRCDMMKLGLAHRMRVRAKLRQVGQLCHSCGHRSFSFSRSGSYCHVPLSQQSRVPTGVGPDRGESSKPGLSVSSMSPVSW
jgi:hypothetical protein